MLHAAWACLLLQLIVSTVCAQPYWVKDIGGLGNDHTADVRTDTDGSIYVTGEFSGSITFGGNTYASAGSMDMFVARMTPAGDVTWFKHGGGPGIDRGLKVDVGGSVVAVTGEFMGTAAIMGTTLTSAGGTADMYVALLDKSDGSLQWLRQGGGAAGTDSPGGVAIAPDGRVSVAGEFRGVATWDGISLTSMTDPGTNQPGTDVFVVSYSSNGDLLWLKQGSAKYADKGVDLVHGPANELYVTGQFSDTITFDVQHPNILVNASFLLRLDPAGNEVWFRRLGGAGYNHVRDMVLAPDGRLALVGDVQGTMVWSGTPAVNIASGLPHAYYLLSVDLNGSLAAHTVVNSSNGVSGRSLAASGTHIAVLGEFNCRFTTLANHHGAQGIFMATGDEDLFLTRHSLNGLALLEGQQFGGRSGKSAGGIAILPGGDPVFTGSFQLNLIFLSLLGFTSDMSTSAGNLQGNGTNNYCGDQSYGHFSGSISAGLTDGFVARAFVPGRSPYDWWRRLGGDCEREPLQPCVKRGTEAFCTDTVTACGTVNLNMLTNFSHTPGGGIHYLGPAVEYLWSNGSTNSSIQVTATGYHGVTVSSTNGCWQWTDSIYVIINPLPGEPLVSDDVVLNTNAVAPVAIEMCHPQTHWVWATLPEGTTFHYWTTPFSGPLPGQDSVRVDTTGTYTFTVTNEFNCIRQTTIVVTDNPAPVLPDVTVELAITFPDDVAGSDTLQVCEGSSVSYMYTPAWSIDGEPGELPSGLMIIWGTAPGGPIIPADDGPQEGSLVIDGPGWYAVDLLVKVSNEPCGEDSIIFSAVDSIYVDVLPTAATTVSLSGPSHLCDGDSVILVASCTGCDLLTWAGTGFVQLSADSILAGNAGTYSVTATAEDVNGCEQSSQATHFLTIPVGPILNMAPANGILCPDAVATLTTTSMGTDHIWYGPQGAILDQGATLETMVSGEYYLGMVVGGCTVTSNNVLITQYGTPFLDIQPVPALCFPGDQVVIHAVSVPNALVQWQAPLSGNAFTQTISQPGTYSASVTACGIVTPLSITIPYAPAGAEIVTPGPYVICPSGSLVLEGSGEGAMTWLPGGETGTSLIVTGAGTYTLQVQNAGGCTASSAPVTVGAISFAEPVTTQDVSICAGETAQLAAQGSGTLTWYEHPGGSPIGTGNTLSLVPGSSTVIYVQQQDSGCAGGYEEVDVHVAPIPEPITIMGPDSLCLGQGFALVVAVPDSIDLVWETPVGTDTGVMIDNPASSTTDGGYYTCTPWLQGCPGIPDSHLLTINVPGDLSQPGHIDLCAGGVVDLAIPAGFTHIQWSNGSTASMLAQSAAAILDVEALDIHGCPVSARIMIDEVDCELIIPNVFTPNGDGHNDAWIPTGGFKNARALIYNRWGTLIYEGDMVNKPWSGQNSVAGGWCSDGTYYYILTLERADGQVRSHTGHVQLMK